MNDPIYIFAKWSVKEDCLEKVLSLIPELIKESKKEPGNLGYNIYQSASDSHTLILFEAYKDQESLDIHRSSEHFKSLVLQKIVPLLEKREVEILNELL